MSEVAVCVSLVYSSGEIILRSFFVNLGNLLLGEMGYVYRVKKN